MLSTIQKGKAIAFPAFTGLQVYMQPHVVGNRLTPNMGHYQSTIDDMLSSVKEGSLVYLMVDEKFVKKGEFHRRPGVHVDGFWNPGMSAHGPSHGPIAPSHRPGRHFGGVGHEQLRLASNTGDAVAYVGEYQRDFMADWRGGDCKEIDVASLMPVYLEPGVCHVGDVFTLHESLQVKQDCLRQLVRINVPCN